MTAERFRMDVISTNLANAHTVAKPGEDPYRRRNVILKATNGGVQIEKIEPDMSPLQPVYEPANPYADANGMVYYSNVNPIYEMVDMMTATRAYEANVAAFNSAKSMIKSALNIGRI